MIMGILVLIYAVAFVGIAWYLSKNRQDKIYARIGVANQIFRDTVKKKDALYVKRMQLEEDAFQIFTLYEMTREITKSLSEDEAFQVFKQKLARHVSFQECSFEDTLLEKGSKERDGSDVFTFHLRGKDQVGGYLVLTGVKVEDRDKVRILGHQFAMALRRVRLYQKVGKLAITDGLTGVYTRRYVMDRLEEEMARCQLRGLKMSFLMMDVDHFKSLNDRYGHLTGDQALRKIGLFIRENIREIDIPGRYGGEEFCVILPETNLDGAFYAAERIRKAVEEGVINAYDEKLKVTLSLGIATYPEHGQTIPEIMDKADWALYRSKKRGRNKVSAFGIFEK